MTTSTDDKSSNSSLVTKRAADAIDLFLEYRDRHGYSEEAAKYAAINEFSDAEHFAPPPIAPQGVEEARRLWHRRLGRDTNEPCPTERECRAFDAGYVAARSARSPTPMPVSRYSTGDERLEPDPKGAWVAYGDYEALERLYLQHTTQPVLYTDPSTGAQEEHSSVPTERGET